MRNILIEVNCNYNIYEKENNPLPKCCILGPNIVNINCFKYDEYKNQNCPFLDFRTAKSTIALTDAYGNVINSNAFIGDSNLQEEEFRIKEREWISTQNKKINT